MNQPHYSLLLLLSLLIIVKPVPIRAQVTAYPSKGQTQKQQNKDAWQCHQWATSNTGIDPITMADKEIAPQAATTESVATGAKKGILHGLFAGAVLGGDFARTTPMGAGVGALMALHRHRKAMEKQHQEYIEAYNERAEKLKIYDQAYGVCMKGRGYTVN